MFKFLLALLILQAPLVPSWGFESWQGEYTVDLRSDDGSEGGGFNPPKDCGHQLNFNVTSDKIMIDIFSKDRDEQINYTFGNLNQGRHWKNGEYQAERAKIFTDARFDGAVLKNTIKIKESSIFNLLPRTLAYYSVAFVEYKEGILMMSLEDHLLKKTTALCTYKKD